MIARLLPVGRVARAALALLVALAALGLLGAAGTRIGPLAVPAWDLRWLLAVAALASLAAGPRPAPLAVRPTRLLAAAAGVVLLGVPLAGWKARLLDGPARLPASVSRPEPSARTEQLVLVDLGRHRARIPLWRLTGRTQEVRLDVSAHLMAPRTGVYRFTLTADDHALLQIDGRDALAASGAAAAEVHLEQGLHRLRLVYEQKAGPALLALSWDRPDTFELLPLEHYLAARPEGLAWNRLRQRQGEIVLALLLSLAWWGSILALLLTAGECRRAWRDSLAASTLRARWPAVEAFAAGLPFLLSGTAALVYQVAWQRLLVLASGVGIYSVATIVAAFMAGLGIGSLWGGRLSARTGPVRALWSFALIELALAAFALMSGPLYYELLYGRLPELYARSWSAGIAHFLSLLPPTVLMGMSLPFLVRAFVRDTATAPRIIGYLYGINVVGAALGALLTPWVFIRHLGISGAIQVGAALNFAAGLGAILLGRLAARPDQAASPAFRAAEAAPAAPSEAAGGRPLALWAVLYAASGFMALSLEILWFRVIDVAVKSSAFTFGTVLAIYLAGLAGGSLAGTVLVGRVRRPLRAFLLCQCAIAAHAALAIVLLVRLPPDLPGYSWWVDYWGRYTGLILGQAWPGAALFRLYVILPVALYLPATLLMGLSFPILQRAVQVDPRTSGWRVGLLQGANIAGSAAGSLLVGFLGLTLLGTAGSFRAVLVLGLVFAALGLRAYGPRSFALPLALLAVLLVLFPGQRDLWLRLHGQAAPETLLAEDATSVVAVTPSGPERWRVSVNGLGHSSLPYGGIHTLLGALPAVVHPDPREVAIIGLGSGDTAWAAGCRPETRSVTVFEIAFPQPGLLRELSGREPIPALRSLLGDPRLSLRLEDGRHALRKDRRAYDLIEMDPLEPHWAGSGHIYSVEFFRLCASRLRRGGLFCAWTPTDRVRRSFQAAFPHVLEFRQGSILLGSNEPLSPDPDAWTARLRAPSVRSYLGEEAADQLEALLHGTHRPKGPGSGALNQDLFPRDEFLAP